MIIGTFLRIMNCPLGLKYLAVLLVLMLTQACHSVGEQAFDPINTRFNINQSDIQLINGYAEQMTSSDTSSKITTQVWGEPKVSDLNADGQRDAVLILSQNTGGSGTFYYLVVAIREGNQYKGSKGVLLGDRIQPQKIKVVANRVTVEFLERFKGQPYTTSPSVLTKQKVVYDTDSQQLIPVEQNFAGEADPAIMTLGMKTWFWEKTQYNNDSVIEPNSPKEFSLKFATNGKLLISTDCNSMGGEYSVTDKQIAITKMFGTRMFCKASQEQAFAKMLHSVSSYFFTSKGRLVLELKFDSGTMIFR